jgi:hypothetical protein
MKNVVLPLGGGGAQSRKERKLLQASTNVQQGCDLYCETGRKERVSWAGPLGEGSEGALGRTDRGQGVTGG